MADVNFVNSLYRNVLAREPDVDGANAWASYGGTEDQIRAAFINSAEAQSFVKPIIRLYEGLLGRTPDAGGLDAWADALRGGQSLNSITEAFLTSQEAGDLGFDANLDNEAFVTKLYESMGREPDTAGLDGWVAELANGMPKAAVAQAFMESAENLQHSNDFVTGYLTLRSHGNADPTTADIDGFIADQDFVEGLYRNVLAREPDADGANAWTSQLTGDATRSQVTAAFLESGEAQSLVNPIIRLYEGLLNRAPDAGGLDAWVDALRGGASLTDVTAAFLNSDEAITNGFAANLSNQAFVTKLYQSMGRTQEQINADTAGFEGWVAALDGGMTKAQVAQAFMESPENQQDSDGFVTGWGALRAAGNPGPTTAQLDNFSDIATTAAIIASADAVGTSTTTRPTGAGAAPYNLSDTAANLMATQARLLNGATTVTVQGVPTLAQLQAIDAATTGALTYVAVTGTATALAADAATNGGAGTYIKPATNVTVTDIATLAQLQAIDTANSTGTLTYMAVTGTAAALAADAATNAGTGTYIKGGTNVTVTGAATIAQLTAIDAATAGTLTYTAVTGSAAALAAAPALLDGATDITATDAATVVQAGIIEAANNSGTTTYNITDTGANLAGANAAVLNHATNISASGSVTVSQAATIEAATNGGTNSYNISDTPSNLAASTDAVLSLAGTVTASVAATATQAATIAGFTKAVVYSVSDAAANLAGAAGPALNEAETLTASTPATVAQATTIDNASNTGATTYNINDTGAAVTVASATVLNHAGSIDVTDDAATLADAQVTDTIIGKFDTADRLTLNATLGTTLSALSATTLADPRVLALNAANDAVTLTDARVTDTIIGKFDMTDHLTLNASGATLSALSGTTLADARVLSLNATDNAVSLYDAGDGKITDAIITKFDSSDRLELTADHGTTLSALDAATLADDRVYVLDAVDNQVTLTGAQVTDAIVVKFDPTDTLTLNASGATLAALSAETLAEGNPSLVLNASDNAITFTANQFFALDTRNHSVDSGDAITIVSGPAADALDLHSVGGAAGVTLRYDSLPTSQDDISGFDPATDTLQFSSAAFTVPSGLGAIDPNEFLVAADVSATGGTGFSADHRFLYNNGSGANAGDLFYDVDGNGAGAAVQIATMVNVPGLTVDDIIMIA